VNTHRTLARIAALVLGTLLGLGLGELLLRGLWTLRHGTATDRGGYSDTFLAHHERFGWLGVPGARVRHRTTEFDVAIEINQLGLRQRLAGAGAPTGATLCLLGDSFAFGQGVEESERVGERLAELHPGLRVHNVALPALGTDQALLLYSELEGPQRESRVVVLLYFLEDVLRNVAHERHGLAKPWFELEEGELRLRGVPVPEVTTSAGSEPPRGGVGPRTRAWLRRHSALYVLLRRALLDTAPDLLARDDEDPYPDYAARASAWQLTAALLERLRDAVHARGAELVLTIVPERWHLAVDRPREHQIAVLQACERLAVPALDLTPILIASDATRGRSAYYPGDGHWNPAGHRLAAQALSEFLDTLGLIE
jgi:hypothetical protein